MLLGGTFHFVGRTARGAGARTLGADSDAEAEKIVKHYQEGIDEGAVLGMMESWGIPKDKDTSMAARRIGARSLLIEIPSIMKLFW